MKTKPRDKHLSDSLSQPWLAEIYQVVLFTAVKWLVFVSDDVIFKVRGGQDYVFVITHKTA